MRYLFMISVGVCTLFGDPLSHTTSMQGYTGIINTPNAQVMNEGDLTFQYNNQFDNHLRNYDYTIPISGEDNYIFGVGLLPYFEMQGRLSEAPGYHTDLSANVKFQIPYKHKYLPNIAIGVQDLGGEASHYNNTYIVLDKEWKFIRASIGYGYGKSSDTNNNLQRMDGLFGGVEVRAFDWLYFLAEDDSVEQHVGIRLEMPREWSRWFQANALIAANLENDYDTSVAVNLTFPLHEKRSPARSGTQKSNTDTSRAEAGKAEQKEPVLSRSIDIDVNTDIPVSNSKNRSMSIDQIQKKMVDIGLENVQIATKGTQLYITYENNVFLWNELDALGVVMGLATRAPGPYNRFVIEPKKSKTVILSIRGDLNAARAYYLKRDTASQQKLAHSLSIESPLKDSAIGQKTSLAHNSFLRPRLEITPVLKTFVGTEFGVFDYMLWLRGNLYFNLYKGIDFSVVGDLAVAHSDNFDPDIGPFRLSYNDSHLESVMLHKSDNFFGSINTLSAGTFEENFVGVMDQWIYNTGNHTFKLKAGYFEQYQDGNWEQEYFLGKIEKRKLFLAKYSYMLEEYDILGEIRIGQYWNQDKGFDLKMKRFFGDVAVSLIYQQSEGSNNFFSEQTDHFVGIGIELPLTPKHTPVYKYGQVMGTNAFSYGIKTTVMRDDGSNTIVTGGGVDPKVAFDSENYFLNRNRLQLGYIQNHLFRLINSFDEYVEKI